MFVLHSDVIAVRTFCLVFDCYVRDKHTLYLFFTVTFVISALSIFYLIVTLEISTNYICTL